MKTAILAAALLTVGAFFLADRNVTYPEGFRAWQHVKTGMDGDIIHHIYANSKALTALEQGEGRYTPGAIFVADFVALERQGQTRTEGERQKIDVMEYDPDSFPETGGWGFESFAGSSKTDRIEQDVGACWACHEATPETGFVFSKLRD